MWQVRKKAAGTEAEAPRSVRCYVLTVSDTRTVQNDTSGLAIRDLLVTGGHHVAGYGPSRPHPHRQPAQRR